MPNELNRTTQIFFHKASLTQITGGNGTAKLSWCEKFIHIRFRLGVFKQIRDNNFAKPDPLFFLYPFKKVYDPNPCQQMIRTLRSTQFALQAHQARQRSYPYSIWYPIGIDDNSFIGNF